MKGYTNVSIKETKTNFVLKRNRKVTKSYVSDKRDFEIMDLIFSPETLKYWVGVQRGQSYVMGGRCLFSVSWPPF